MSRQDAGDLGPGYEEYPTGAVEEHEESRDMGSNEERSNSGGVNWPTVLTATGLSAIISALVLAIGLVGLLMTDVGKVNSAQQTPTVVNLGQTAPAAAPPAAPAAPAAPADAAAPAPAATDVPAVPDPVAPVPDAPAAPVAPAPAAPAASAPTTPTLGAFQRDLNLLRSGASNQQKGQVLEGGAAAVAPMSNLFRIADQFRAAGVRYELVGPVTHNGSTATARLKLTGPGYQPSYMTLRWVWKDGRWKLTNKSVCEIAAWTQTPCNLR